MGKAAVELQNLTKSCNEALILAALREGPKHGYQLALDIERRGGGLFRFNHGTLYPILHKLEKEGLIRGAWSEEGAAGADGAAAGAGAGAGRGRRRKSYELTRRGSEHAARQVAEWRAFLDRLLTVLEGGEE